MRTFVLALVCVGCGASSATTAPPDGGAPAADAPSAGDAPPATGPLTVTVLDGSGSPVSGATVVTQLATGEVLRVAMTGSNGQAATLTVAGGAATAGFVEADGPRLVTATGLQLGQSVTLRARPPAGGISFNADVEPPSAVTGAVGYLIQIPCRYHPQTTVFGPTVPVWDDCVVGGVWSAAITALGDQSQPLAYTSTTGIPTATTTPTFPDWKTDLGTFSVTLSEAPITCTFCARFSTFRRTAGGLRYDGGATPLSLTQGAGAQLVVPFAPSLVAPEIGVSLAIPLDASLEATVRRTYAANPVNDPLDLSSLLLTRITSVTADPTGSRVVVRWAAAGIGKPPAFVLVDLAWKAVNGDGGVENRSWTVLAPPPGDQTVTLPLLPPELAGFAPTLPGDVGDYDATLTLAADTAFATYADFLTADWPAELDGTGPVRGGTRTVTLMKHRP